MRTRWEMKSYDPEIVENLKNELQISDLLARLLAIRDIKTAEEAREFLEQDSLEALTSPFLFSGMDALVERVEAAIEKQEKVLIYGDYDVDGICSVVILTECLQFMGAKVDYRVPDRFSEGYGLNCDAIKEIAESGYTLILTVDCGITSIEEAALCKKLGVDLVITDHHTPGAEIPDGYAVINPKLDTNEKALNLCGAGLAFKTTLALTRGHVLEELVDEWLILAAIATVADVVPLVYENRILVKRGLKIIGNTKRFGLIKLLQAENLWGQPITTDKLAFQIIPKLNSAGRLETAEISIDALLTMDEMEAEQKINHLLELNTRRREIENDILQLAIQQIDKDPSLLEKPVLIVQGEEWNHGIVGILASRLVTRYHKPTVVITWDGNVGKGSGRSIEGISLYDILVSGRPYLERFGGHKMAAGLTVLRENFAAYYETIMAKAEELSQEVVFDQIFHIDTEISAKQIVEEGLSTIKQLEPTGEGNPSPQFLMRGCPADFYKRIGKNKEHVLCHAGSIDAIAFGQAEFLSKAQNYLCQDLVFTISENEYMGVKRLQLVIQEFFPTPGYASRIQETPSLTEQKIQRIAHLLHQNENVLFLYEDVRSLKKHLEQLRFYFRDLVFLTLHGQLPPEEFRLSLQDLMHLNGRIILMTKTALKYITASYSLPETIHTVMKCWNYHEDIPYDWGNRRVLQWEEQSISSLNVEKPAEHSKYFGVVYANLSGTVEKIQGDYPEVQNEIQHLFAERCLLRQNSAESGRTLLLDGVPWDEKERQRLKPEWLELWNIPYCPMETETLYAWQNEAKIPLYQKFPDEEVGRARQLIERLYAPPESLLTSVNRLFSETFIRDKIYNVQLEKFFPYLESKLQIKMTPLQLEAILRIFADLKLVEYHKKGSTLAIHLLNHSNGRDLPFGQSLFYQEGLASRAALDKVLNLLQKGKNSDQFDHENNSKQQVAKL